MANLYHYICLLLLLQSSSLASAFESPKVFYDNSNNIELVNKEASIHVINVGQGDATLIKCPNGKFTLIDFGSNKKPVQGISSSIQYIKDQLDMNNPIIENLIITHSDIDHYNKIAKLLDQNITFNNILLGGNIKGYKNKKGLYKKGAEWIKNSNVTFLQSSYSSKHKKQGFYNDSKWNGTISCHGIFNNGISKNSSPLDFFILIANYTKIANTTSIVILTRYQTKNMNTPIYTYLTGDAMNATENKIMEIYSGNKEKTINLLKLGHHGSITSSSVEWIKWVNPTISFVSAKQRGSWKHPNCDVVQRLGIDITLNIENGYSSYCVENKTKKIHEYKSSKLFSTTPSLSGKNNRKLGVNYKITMKDNSVSIE